MRVATVGGRQPEPFEVALFSPFTPTMGEKVADRPDEGAFNQFCVRKKPPHPNHLRQVICGNATWQYSVNQRKRLGGEGIQQDTMMPNEQLQNLSAAG